MGNAVLAESLTLAYFDHVFVKDYLGEVFDVLAIEVSNE